MKTLIAILCLAASCSCVSQEFEFDRKDAQKEIDVGRMMYDYSIRSGLISKNEANNNRVQRIFRNLLSCLDQRRYPYQAVVLAAQAGEKGLTSSINAGCWPGGYIVVEDALVSLFASDDALAMVLAHEIGHAHNRHAVRSAKDRELGVLLASVSVALGGDPQLASQNIYFQTLRYSRAMEAEADSFGIQLFLKAGYNASQAPAFADYFAEQQRKTHKAPEYEQTHPDPTKRAAFIRDYTSKHPSAPADAGIVLAAIDLSKIVGDLPPATIAANPYFPLAVGWEWEYEVASGQAKTSYVNAVKAQIETPTGIVFRLETRLSPGSVVQWQCLATASAVWRRNMPERDSSKWSREFVFEPTESNPSVRKVSPVASLTLPCGTFTDVIEVELQNLETKRTYHLWFAKDVGLVKRVCDDTGVSEALARYKRPS